MNIDAPGAYAQDYSDDDYYFLKMLAEKSWECTKTYENKTIPGIDPSKMLFCYHVCSYCVMLSWIFIVMMPCLFLFSYRLVA